MTHLFRPRNLSIRTQPPPQPSHSSESHHASEQHTSPRRTPLPLSPALPSAPSPLTAVQGDYADPSTGEREPGQQAVSRDEADHGRRTRSFDMARPMEGGGVKRIDGQGYGGYEPGQVPQVLGSPKKADAGLYDTRLVSHTLSQNPHQTENARADHTSQSRIHRPCAPPFRSGSTPMPPLISQTSGSAGISEHAIASESGHSHDRLPPHTSAAGPSASSSMAARAYSMSAASAQPSTTAKAPPAVLVRAGSATIAPASFALATSHVPERSASTRGFLFGSSEGGRSGSNSSSGTGLAALTASGNLPGSSLAMRSGSSSGSGMGTASGSANASTSLFTAQGEFLRSGAQSIKQTLAHSSPNSPWSLLTVQALPVFAGSTIKHSMENLNQLCSNHIISTTQRTTPTKVTAVLLSDLREFIASGMLTLKTRLEGDQVGLIERMSDTWWFFWSRVLGYLEGVFLPYSQLQSTATPASPVPRSLIPVRQLLLSGFLFHVVLPHLPRLTAALSYDHIPSIPPSASGLSPSTLLGRIQQMTLVLATQASYSAIKPLAAGQGTSVEDAVAIASTVDRDVREQVEELGRMVRWHLARAAEAESAAANGHDMNGIGRHASSVGKKRGWRASIIPESAKEMNSLGAGIDRLYVSGAGPRVGEPGIKKRQMSNMTTDTQTSGYSSGPMRQNHYTDLNERQVRHSDRDEEGSSSVDEDQGEGTYTPEKEIGGGYNDERRGTITEANSMARAAIMESDTAPSTVTATGTWRVGALHGEG